MRRITAIASLSAAALLLGGYAVADIADVVPGVLTDAAPPPTPAPFPTPQTADITPDAALAEPVSEHGKLPDKAAVATELTALLSGTPEQPGGLGPSYSVLVQDAASGTDFFTANADHAKVPASVLKVLTGIAAIATLGPDWRATTTVTTGASDQEIVLRGGGDVLLAADAGNPQQANGHAGLGDLATQVAENLRTKNLTSVSVVVDDGAFVGPTQAPEWVPSDISNGYVAPLHALSVNAGRVSADRYANRHADPGLAAANDFVTALKNRGITVTGAPQRQARPGTAELLGQVQSATVADVAGYILRTSDNTAAEALARQIAIKQNRGTSFADGGQAVQQALADLGVNVTGATLADGSGMSKSSRVSSRTIAHALQIASGPQSAALRSIVADLPVGGVQGTLSERFGSAAQAKGVARAKTGTLRGVTALAGVVRSNSGRLLTFSILADQVPNSYQGRKTSDQMVAVLAR